MNKDGLDSQKGENVGSELPGGASVGTTRSAKRQRGRFWEPLEEV